ncbi:Phage-related baseplate assembly protein [Anoxybacillus sp. BCO1]|nr:Phage-related baseplate assembly protein [Anoxybacillus sp. BCO1]
MFEKIGIVTSVYPNKCTARVKFEDADDLISAELQVVVRGSLNNKDYWMPKVGEHVLCIFTKQKSGYIVGSIYSKQSPPPVNVEYKRHMQFEDGTTIEYDSKSKTLDINCVGPIKIKARVTCM